MNSIKEFIDSVKSSRKRTGVLYCSGSFEPIITYFYKYNPKIQVFDCTTLYNGTLIFSASELLNLIEQASKGKTTIITNIETFIVSNSHNFSEQLARLLTVREPLKPLFFIFYSKKIYTHFKNQFEVKEFNQRNTIEL